MVPLSVGPAFRMRQEKALTQITLSKKAENLNISELKNG